MSFPCKKGRNVWRYLIMVSHVHSYDFVKLAALFKGKKINYIFYVILNNGFYSRLQDVYSRPQLMTFKLRHLIFKVHNCIVLLLPSDTKKAVITKILITSEVLFRSSQNFGSFRSHLFGRQLQSFKSSLEILLVQCIFYWTSTMCSRWAPRRCRNTWIWWVELLINQNMHCTKSFSYEDLNFCGCLLHRCSLN